MSLNIDLYIDQGSDFLAVLPPVQSPGVGVVLLTGYTVVSQMRRSYSGDFAIQLQAVIVDATNGIIQLRLPKVTTSTLYAARWVYDVLITDRSGFTTTAFCGIITVNPGVTSSSIITPYIETQVQTRYINFRSAVTQDGIPSLGFSVGT